MRDRTQVRVIRQVTTWESRQEGAQTGSVEAAHWFPSETQTLTRCSSLADLQKKVRESRNSEQLLRSFQRFYQTSSSFGTNVCLPKPEELDFSQRCRSSKLAAIIRPAVLDHMASVRSLGFLRFWVFLSLVRPPSVLDITAQQSCKPF